MGDIGAGGLGLGRSGGRAPPIGLRPAHPAVAPLPRLTWLLDPAFPELSCSSLPGFLAFSSMVLSAGW